MMSKWFSLNLSFMKGMIKVQKDCQSNKEGKRLKKPLFVVGVLSIQREPNSNTATSKSSLIF